MLKNGYSAEFGRGDGAVVLVQTKSGTNQLPRRCLSVSAGRRLEREVVLRARRRRSRSGTAASTASPLGFPVVQNKLFAFGNVDRTKSDGENTYARDFFTAGGARGAAADARQRHAGEPRVDPVDPGPLPARSRTNDPRSTRTYRRRARHQLARLRTTPAGSTGTSRDGNTLTGRYQWTRQIREAEDVIVGEQALQNNKQQNLGITWTRVHELDAWSARRATASASARPTSTSPTATTRRSSASPASPVVGLDHRQRRQFSDPPRPDRSPVRLQPDGAGVPAPTRSRPASTSAARRSTTSPTTSRAASGRSTPVCGGVTYATPYAAMLDGCVAVVRQKALRAVLPREPA